MTLKTENVRALSESALYPLLTPSVLSESESDGFRLLCTDGTQAPLSHYRNCNLGRGPGGGVVTRVNFRKIARKFLEIMQVKLLCFLSMLYVHTHSFILII